MKDISIVIGEEKIDLEHDGLQWLVNEQPFIEKSSGHKRYKKTNYFRAIAGAARYLTSLGLSKVDANCLAEIETAIKALEVRIYEELTNGISKR